MKKDATIAVFGGRGLAGSAIVRRLRQEGYKKIIIPTSETLDLRSQEQVDEFFCSFKIDYVFHAAALVGGIMANKTRKAEFLYDNLMIQSNVIDSAYCGGVKKLLFLGTSCIYPAGRQHPLKEDELLTGPLEPTNDAYAIAKIAGIKLCDFYREQYGFDAISLMPPNLYGPRDNFNENSGHVLASLMNRFHNAHKNRLMSVDCWGDGSPMREFLYVEDLADACLFLMENYSQAGHINVGTGIDITIRQLAESIKKVVGYEGGILWDTKKPNGNPRKLLNSDRVNELGWKPKVSLEEGLKLTYQWYLENV